MPDRAKTLADQFERAHEEFISVVEPLPDEQWFAHCPKEDRTVAALSRHVAEAYAFETRAFRQFATGQPWAVVSREALDGVNADDGQAFRHADKEETLALLRSNAVESAAFVRSLSDEQLARSGRFLEYMPVMTVEQWVEHTLIGHITEHLASIQKTIGTPST